MPGPTPRQQARAANLERIKELALQQLADSGAATLSLRAIARELNIVSSAIYRYYPGRDELITDLVIDAYGDLADQVEAATAGRRSARRRWTACCLAVRHWALAQPHRFALVYGSAIPGYVAPATTIEPAGRVVQAVFTAATGATTSSPTTSSPTAPEGTTGRSLGRPLRAQLGSLGAALAPGADDETVLSVVGAFARVVGLLTLELNGHLVGGFEPADALFEALVEREADTLGLGVERRG